MFISPPCPPPQSPPKPIIIWVHGTRPSGILPFLAENQEIKTIIDESVALPLGLHPVSSLKTSESTTLFLKTLAASQPTLFPEENIYIFGWSGCLDIESRKEEAEELLRCIHILIEQEKNNHGIPPAVSLISHSHGGNVVLAMALHLHKYPPLSIERTILLAVPVQHETASLINNPMFGKVYSLHSHIDFVQVIDPQRLYPYKQAFLSWQKTKSIHSFKDAFLLGNSQPFFSQRHFPITDNVVQAAISWKAVPISHSTQNATTKIESFIHLIANRITPQKRGILHTEFITPSFIRHLPKIIQDLDTHILAYGYPTSDIEVMI